MVWRRRLLSLSSLLEIPFNQHTTTDSAAVCARHLVAPLYRMIMAAAVSTTSQRERKQQQQQQHQPQQPERTSSMVVCTVRRSLGSNSSLLANGWRGATSIVIINKYVVVYKTPIIIIFIKYLYSECVLCLNMLGPAVVVIYQVCVLCKVCKWQIGRVGCVDPVVG
jgi:hypothetical protein